MSAETLERSVLEGKDRDQLIAIASALGLKALSRAKKGDTVKGKNCGDAAIQSQYELGSDLGVEGTPAIFTQNGDYVGGYLAPAELVQAIQESQKTAVAAR